MKTIWRKMVALIMALLVGVMVLPANALAVGNTIANATPISFGKSYSGGIMAGESRDFYKFTLQSSGRVSIAISGGKEDLEWAIYDPNGEWVYSNGNEYDSILGANRCTDRVDLTKGSYYIAIGDYYERSGCTYTFKLSFTSARESFTEIGSGTNNTILKANKISKNKIYRGQIAQNDKIDFYKFTVDYSGATRFTVDTIMKESYYALYNGSAERLWSTQGEMDSLTGKNHTSELLQLKKGTYYLAIEPYYDSYTNTGNYTFMLSRYISKPSISKIYNTSSGVKLQWKKSSGAAGYQVYRRAGSGKWTKVKTTKAASWTDTKAKTNGAKYQYKVYAYNGNAKSVASATKTIYRLSGSAIKSAYNSAGKKLTVKWSRNTKASGYQIKYVTGSRSKTITVKGNKNVKKVIKNLKKGKTYKVYVRSYKNVSKVKYVSAWSKAKSVKIRK